MMKSLSTQIQAVKHYAQTAWDNGQALLQVNEDAYQQLLAEMKAVRESLGDSFANETISLDDKLALTTYFNVINYCYVHPVSRKSYQFRDANDEIWLNSQGLYHALYHAPVDWKSATSVLHLTEADWVQIVQTDDEFSFYDLMPRFAKLQTFAHHVHANDIPNLASFISQRDSAEALFNFLVASNVFVDEFLKRAQLAVSMLASLLGNTSNWPDLQYLTLMADYRIPQLFYNAGVLQIVDPELLERLTTQQQIAPNSVAEQALRASVIIIGQRLAYDLALSERLTDKALWELAGQWVRAGKMSIPHMLVPTDKY